MSEFSLVHDHMNAPGRRGGWLETHLKRRHPGVQKCLELFWGPLGSALGEALHCPPLAFWIMPHVLLACSITGMAVTRQRAIHLDRLLWELAAGNNANNFIFDLLVKWQHNSLHRGTKQLSDGSEQAVPVLQFSCAELDVLTGAYLHRQVSPPSRSALGHTSCFSLEGTMRDDTDYLPSGLHWLTCHI